MSIYACTKCGERIDADTRPACPHCLSLMDMIDNITVIEDTELLEQFERYLKTVKQITQERKDYDLNVNSYQYDIRQALRCDASPVVSVGEVTDEYVKHLQDDLRELTERLRSEGYPVQSDEIQRYITRLDDMGTGIEQRQ